MARLVSLETVKPRQPCPCPQCTWKFTLRYLCLNIQTCSRVPYSPHPRRRSHRSLGHFPELEIGVFPTSPEEDSASETIHSSHNPQRNGRAGTRGQGWQDTLWRALLLLQLGLSKLRHFKWPCQPQWLAQWLLEPNGPVEAQFRCSHWNLASLALLTGFKYVDFCSSFKELGEYAETSASF